MDPRHRFRNRRSIPGVLAVPLATVLLLLSCAPAQPPNLVLITIDTLRADHLGVYGYPRATSPHLDRLAAEGAWFEHCYSQSAGTNPSHTALFTGRHPRSTGVLSNGNRFPDITSLMDVLDAGGYETAGFVSSIVTRNLAVDGEFQHFDAELQRAERNRPKQLERPAEATLQAASRWLDQRSAATPWFAWIHLIDPHGPYEPPEQADAFVDDRYACDSRQLPVGDGNFTRKHIPAYQRLPGSTRADYYVARYDAEIAYTDRAIGRFLEDLRAAGRYDSTIIVVTADHGETLVDQGRERLLSHSIVTYQEVVRVPLIIKEAGSATALTSLLRQRRLRLIDVMPTLLDRLGMAVPEGVQGVSLLSSSEPPRYIFTFGEHGTPYMENQVGTQLAVLADPWHYIVNTDSGREELYDRSSDPGEQHDLATEQPQVLAELRQALQEYYRSTPPAPSHDIDLTPEVRRQLEALGYTTE